MEKIKEISYNKIKYTYCVLEDQEHKWSKQVKIWNAENKLLFEGRILTNKVRVEDIKQKITFINHINAKQKEISGCSNIDLLESTIYLAGGDDYDGCFTERGAWEFEALKQELKERLIKINFITKEDIKNESGVA